MALKLCLLSIVKQSIVPSKVLIADDGSGTETREMAIEMQESLKNLFTIKHIWQEDIGFKKPGILNETVRQTTGDYLIFIGYARFLMKGVGSFALQTHSPCW